MASAAQQDLELYILQGLTFAKLPTAIKQVPNDRGSGDGWVEGRGSGMGRVIC